MGLEQNYSAEDASRMFQDLQEKKTAEHDLNRIAAAPETYEVKDILQAYQSNIEDLHQQILQIQKYTKAKEEINIVKNEVDRAMLGQIPRSGVAIAEKISLIDRYERIIKNFEGNGAPADLLEKAKATLKSLNEQIVTLSNIVAVAKDKEKTQEN